MLFLYTLKTLPLCTTITGINKKMRKPKLSHFKKELVIKNFFVLRNKTHEKLLQKYLYHDANFILISLHNDKLRHI